MGIKDKKIKENLDFEYECEFHNSENTETYSIKFHQTDEYGDTLTLVHSDGKGFGYSAEMLAEIVDFLRERGLLDGGEKIVKQTGQAATVNTGLPIPQIIDATGPDQTVPEPNYYQRPEILDVAPMQSFSPPSDVEEGNVIAEQENTPHAEEVLQSNTPIEALSSAVPETPEELKGEANNMAKERAEAMKRAQQSDNKNKSTLKKAST